MRMTLGISLCVLAAVALCAVPAWGVEAYWDGGAGTGNWGDSKNWDANGVPNGDFGDAVFYLPGAARLSGPGCVCVGLTGGTRTIRSVRFVGDANQDVWIYLTGTNYSAQRTLAFDANTGDAWITVEPGAEGNFTFGYAGNGQVLMVDSLDINNDGVGSLAFNRPVQSVDANQTLRINGTGRTVLGYGSGNTYAGNTIINGGTLLVTNASGSGTGSGSVTVNAGGLLGGTGKISGAVNVAGGAITSCGADLVPTDTPLTIGTAAAPTSLSLSATSTYEWRLADGNSSLIAVEGDLTLDAGWSLKLIDAGGTPESGVQYDIFTYTGTFTGSIDAAFDADGDWTSAQIFQDDTPGAGRVYITELSANAPGDINQDGVVDAADYIILKRNMGTSGATPAQGDLTGTGGTVDWYDLQVLMNAMSNAGGSGGTDNIPEPAALGLLAMGAASLLRRRRR